MAKENYDATIDKKLTELYEVLSDLNTLKEKTAAVQTLVDGLSEAGKARIAEIEAAMGRLQGGMEKSIETARGAFKGSTDEAKTVIERCVADAKKELDGCVTKVGDAVAAAGKDRIDSMQITANAFSKSVSGLVQSANEGTARMSAIVAELQGLPLVEELRALKTYNEKLTEEIKHIGDAAAKVNGSVADARSSIENKMKSQEELLVDGQKSISGSLRQDFASLESHAKKMSAAIAALEKSVSGKLEALLRDMGNALTAAMSQKADLLSTENARLEQKSTEIESKVDSLTEETKAGFAAVRRKVSVSTWIVGALLLLFLIALFPTIIVGWKAFFR